MFLPQQWGNSSTDRVEITGLWITFGSTSNFLNVTYFEPHLLYFPSFQMCFPLFQPSLRSVVIVDMKSPMHELLWLFAAGSLWEVSTAQEKLTDSNVSVQGQETNSPAKSVKRAAERAKQHFTPTKPTVGEKRVRIDAAAGSSAIQRLFPYCCTATVALKSTLPANLGLLTFAVSVQGGITTGAWHSLCISEFSAVAVLVMLLFLDLCLQNFD